MTDIFVVGEPIIKIICKDLKQKSLCQTNYEDIADICYNIMEKFDNYNILQKQDVTLMILCETEISYQKLNDYLMKK